MSEIPGSVEVISGPMGAGKTTELLMRMEYQRRTAYVPNVIVPTTVAKSGRFKLAKMKTHDGREIVVHPVEDLEREFIDLHAREGQIKEPIAIGIDEVQFFDRSIIPVVERAAREWGWTILCSGLNYDFKGDFWETTWDLLNIADVDILRKGKCAVCGSPALCTQRLHLDGAPARRDEPRVVLDDGNVRYEARCWRCHVGGATRILRHR
ncbi:MAG: thymidine kinase [Firmicutes bacterium]|nr:thymidine kinase [Bacillota bacterium]